MGKGLIVVLYKAAYGYAATLKDSDVSDSFGGFSPSEPYQDLEDLCEAAFDRWGRENIERFEYQYLRDQPALA